MRFLFLRRVRRRRACFLLLLLLLLRSRHEHGGRMRVARSVMIVARALSAA
jgi:hypothetical protein